MEFSNFSEQGDPDIKHYFEACQSGFSFFYFKNDSKNSTLVASIIFKEFSKAVLVKPYWG